jgi:hypothetical protein
MDVITALGRTIPFAFASGINLYATVAILGFCARYELVDLPVQYQAFAHPVVIGLAAVLYVVEFLADKIPWVDSLWDGLHTLIRPLGGALVAVTALGESSPALEAIVALLGGSVAMTTHLTKAGTRAAVNTSPEPVSNWVLSLAEDAFVVGLAYVALRYPYLALAVCLFLIAVIAAFASVLIRSLRRRLRHQPASA